MHDQTAINRRVARIDQNARREQLPSPQAIETPQSPRYPQAKLFKVVSEATGDSVYNCVEQRLDSTLWSDTTGQNKITNKNEVQVEVFNLAEDGSKGHALAAGDFIRAFRFVDSSQNVAKWVGMPLGVQPRLAFCNGDAGSGSSIAAFLDTDVTGEPITVYCSIMHTNHLNNASPRLEDGKPMAVVQIEGSWWCTAIFNKTRNCEAE